MLPKPALSSSIEVPEPALSLSSAGLALLRVLDVSMYFIGTIPDNGTTQPALYRPPHCTVLFIVVCVDRVNAVRTYFARGSGHVTRYGTVYSGLC